MISISRLNQKQPCSFYVPIRKASVNTAYIQERSCYLTDFPCSTLVGGAEKGIISIQIFCGNPAVKFVPLFDKRMECIYRIKIIKCCAVLAADIFYGADRYIFKALVTF